MHEQEDSQGRAREGAMNKALRSLAMRAHSEKELVDKLTRAGYDEKTIAEAMAALAAYDLIDDAAFAAQWTSHRASRGLGPRRIAYELRQKGIEQDSLDEALAQLGEDQLLSSAVAVAHKHLCRGGENARKRALDALNRRGFSYGVARQAILQAAEMLEHDD